MPESGKQLLKRLLKSGWEIIRQNGSHVILKKGTKMLTVPVHNSDLSIGIYRRLCKDGGVNPK